MRNLLFPLLAIQLMFSCTVNAPYQSEQLQSAMLSHERIAVLPFEVVFNKEYKENSGIRGRHSSPKFWIEQERLAGLDMQKEFFLSVAKQVEKGKFEKVIQDFITTNKLLEQSGVKIYDIPKLDKGRLSQLLGVDAVICGETSIVVNPLYGFSSLPGGATTVATLYEGGSGELLWQKELTQRPTNRMDTPKRLGNSTAQQLAKLLPYRNK
jgi:hypothetical protein